MTLIEIQSVLAQDELEHQKASIMNEQDMDLLGVGALFDDYQASTNAVAQQHGYASLQF